MAMAVIFLITLFAVSLAFGTGGSSEANAENYERLQYVEIGDGYVSDFINAPLQTRLTFAPMDGFIRNAQQFCYVFYSGVVGTFYLADNFKISASTWPTNKPVLVDGCTVVGNNYVIWNNANSSPTGSAHVGGLVNENYGTLQGITYYFSGSIYNSTSANTLLSVGGLIGYNHSTGKVKNSAISCGGSLTGEANTEGITVSVGGMIGLNEGNIESCKGDNLGINCNGQVSAYSDMESGSSRAKHCIVNAGGVIGKHNTGTIINCDIKSSASVLAADNTDKWETPIAEFLGGITDLFGFDMDFATDYNDGEHVHPAGSIVGNLDNNASIKNSNMVLTGSAMSYGMAGASNSGSIAGGVVGLIGSNCTSAAGLLNNQIKIKSSVNAFWLQSFDITQSLIEWTFERNIDVFVGGVVGRSLAGKNSLSFKNNFISFERDEGIVEDAADYDSDSYTAYGGLLCGDGILDNIGANNWLCRKPTECNTTKIYRNGENCGELKKLDIFGDGEVSLKGEIVNAESFNVEAKPICSPFYGWTDNMAADSPDFVTTRTKTLAASDASTEYVVFIDTDIRSSGELTQLAKDINLIMEEYWSRLKVTLKWLTVELGKDILVEKGTPVIEEFYGKFKGNNNTISFASGSKITHDFEQESEDTSDGAKAKREMPDYSKRATGLFGYIKSSASVTNLNILFGGSINETNGLSYYAIETYKDDDKKVDKSASDMMNELKYCQAGADNSVQSRTFAYGSFTMSTDLALDKCYAYFLTGDGYVAGRERNPGYIEIVPYLVEVVVSNSYVGVLAGVNEGTISSVNVETTKSAYISVAANSTCFGVICGTNSGSISNTSAVFRGSATLTSRTYGCAGGIFGLCTSSGGKAMSGLNAYVAGEITLKKASSYHQVSIYEYEHAQALSGNCYMSDTLLPDGYSSIAHDSQSYPNSAPKITYEFGVKDLKATQVYKIYGNDEVAETVYECIGTLFGSYSAGAVTISNSAAVSGAKSTFNTNIYNVDSDNNYVGAMIGNILGTAGIPAFSNCWAVMDYEQYKAGAAGRRVIGTHELSVQTGVNRIYVQEAIAIAEIKTNASLPISFTLEAREGLTFSGWYDYTSGSRQVITSGLDKDVFTPQNQNESNRLFVAEVIPLQLFEEQHIKQLAASTNEGRGYLGTTFTLGGDDITLTGFTPIGTEDHPFLGTFDGNGLTIELEEVSTTGNLVGLFGCIGAQGTVKNITVKVTGALGNNNTVAGGAIVAINKGLVGQDLSTGKVIAEIVGSITGKQIGGIAGVNRNVIKNAEAHFLCKTSYVYGELYVSNDGSGNVAGGAIGYNETVDSMAYAKNLIVYYEGKDALHVIPAAGNKAYSVGGIVGKNGVGSALFSSVIVCKTADILGGNGSDGDRSQFRGFLIGYNESQNVDSLWILYQASSRTDTSDQYVADLGAPMPVYLDENAAPKVSNQMVLINGEKHDKGNALIRYGRGAVTVSISGASSAKGGEITFLSTKVKDASGIDFYDYVANFYNGDRVPVSEGNNGYEFAPTVGDAKTDGLTGRVYYAGFCDATISNATDYNRVAANIANDYRLYVEYNVSTSFTLDAATSPNAIGSASRPFRGAINGNGYIVTLNSASAMHAFVGVLGDPTDENHYSRISNLRMVVQAGSYIEYTGSEDRNMGFLTDRNNGTISGVALNVRGYLKNTNGAAGAVSGYNAGVIASAEVVFEFTNYLGTDGYGAIIGKYVGGVVGRNYGTIGNGKANAIDVTIKNNATHDAVLYGTQTVGGVAGENAGEIGSVNVVVKGMLFGGTVSAYVGRNSGTISDGFLVIEKTATYFATESFGMVAGENSGTVGAEQKDYTPVIKAYSYAAPTFGSSITLKVGSKTVATTAAATTKIAGGAVGKNNAQALITSVLVELHASLLSTQVAGGLVGDNYAMIRCCSLLSTDGSAVVSSKAGGVVGVNEADGIVNLTFVTLRGAVGSSVALAGVPATTVAGGFAAENLGGVVTSVVTHYADVYGVKAGLAAGSIGSSGQAINAWVQISNRSLTAVCPDENAFFNAIRVLNDTMLSVSVDYDREYLSFTSQISGVKNWYTDISAWTDDYGILTEGVNKTKLVFTPSIDLMDQEYYVSYDNLTIRELTSFRNFSTLINSRDYYNNVLFRLGNNIIVPSGTVLRPIGTESNPFNGIFDGGFYRITLRKGSGISGAEYAGLFGYTESLSLIENLLFVVEPGATVGSVNSREIGSLVGRNAGKIENVFVNLSEKLTYNSQKRFAGAMIGNHVAGAPAIFNSWISILNGTELAVGNAPSANELFGLNYVGVLGNGATDVEFAKEYEIGTEETILFRCFVPTGIDGNAQQQANGLSYFKRFGGWFSNIQTGARVTGSNNRATVTGLGSFVFNDDINDEKREISFSPYGNVSGQKISLSFIKFTIGNEQDFRDFAVNVNTYGDQGAIFTLLGDITVDFTLSESVGTAESPFTGTFRGEGYKITATGAAVEREYAGVFGCVGVGGLVRDLLIDASGATFGDGKALYSGIAVGLLFGEIRNVVAQADAATVVYTTQGLASSGGIVGRAGKINEAAEVADISYKIDNCWLVLAEGATVTNPVGEDPDLTHPDYYRTNKAVCGVGRKMQIVGEGELRIYKEEEGYGIVFDAVANGSKFYGFIDNRASSEDKMAPIHDVGNGNEWTVREGDKDKAGNDTSPDMLCVIVNKYISTIADLAEVSENVSKGRNYRGIIYSLVNDIEIGTEWDDPADDTSELVPFTFNPIGGVVVVSSAGGGDYTNYVERDFIGGFDGQGHTIRFKQGVTIKARYAGLFGRVGAEARIRNLVVESDCEIGYDTGVNSTRTLYAGVLAGYALGGKYENVAVVMNKRTSLYGSVGTGRGFGYLPRTVGNVATNCWAISYNSKENYELNAAEMLYNAAFNAEAFASSGTTPNVGSNQGGFNNLMVVAAGEVRLNVPTASTYYFSYDKSYWYSLNDFDGAFVTKEAGEFRPDASASRQGYNVSFLKSTIDNLYELYRYAQNINAGYNFYHLTFKLTQDLTIDTEWDDPTDGIDDLVPFKYVPIGVRSSGVNGTFDGQGHTITLEEDVRVVGEYAGIFGHVSSDGTITNLRIVVKGTLGKNDYKETDLAFGYQNTLYAGAIAYNEGKLENVIVIADGASLVTRNGITGIAIAYDKTNLVKNVWALVDASSFLDTVGRSEAGDTGVNTMKIIGIGTVDATFKDPSHADHRVRFLSTSAVPVMGWYKSFEKDQQISSAMITGGSLANGAGGHLLSPIDMFGVTYEVAVIKTNITTPQDLIAVAGDVNIGGYSFESITFTLEADISIPTSEMAIGYLSVGTAEHPFKGTFLGSPSYKITVKKDYAIYGVFGYNSGTIRGLSVVVNGVVGEQSSTSDQVYGTIAAVNKGLIESCFVEIRETGRVVGYTVGGIVGRNLGTVRDCVAVVRGGIYAETEAGNVVNAGGLVGVNEGTVEGTTDFSAWNASGLIPTEGDPYVTDANLYLFGKISAYAGSNANANAGGAIGNHYTGTATSLILCQTATSEIVAESLGGSGNAGGAIGYGRASVNYCVVFAFGSITSSAYAGGTAGYLDGVTTLSTWQVTMGVTPDAVGGGSRSVNRLTIKGNGKLKASVDENHSVMFINITEADGSEIDGWYVAPTIAVDPDTNNTGNVSENKSTFLPLKGAQNKTVTVIFVNTEIRTAQDLVDMASSVSGGLSGDDIVFTLMNDVTVDAGVLVSTIGTEEYPFRNVFDGQNFTITLLDGALPSGDYVGLFGYTASDSTIRNLKIVAKGATTGESVGFGDDKSERTALLACYSEGTVTKVTVTVEAGASLVGHIAAPVLATSFGEVTNVTVNVEGKILATNDNTAIAGGVIGANDGTLSGVSATFAETAVISAADATTVYAGAVAGENYKAISSVNVVYGGMLIADGKMTAYSGVVTGLNLGYVDKAYVEITQSGAFRKGTSAGLVGNNVNSLTTALVKVVGSSFGTGDGENGGVDSAIGFTKTTDPIKVHNVWVYSDRVENVSQAACVNAMIYEAERVLSCPTAEEVLAGKIAFVSDLTDDGKSFDLFAAIEDGAYDAGSGAAMNNVVYTGGKIKYIAYDLVGLDAVVRQVANVRVCLVKRNEISHGEEFYAFALAVNSGEYTFDAATVTLGADFTLPARTFPAIDLPSSVTLNGAHHVVTVGNATLTSGVFDRNEGRIDNVGLRLTKAETSALVGVNQGAIANAVVYLENGASVQGGRYFATTNSGTVTNPWLVVRSATELGQGSVPYAILRINGVGTLLQGGENGGLTFTASTDTEEGMIFVGYTASGTIFSQDSVFDTAAKDKAIYTAEFLSTRLDSDYKLQVLSDVSLLGYVGEETTFTLYEDLTVSASLFGNATAPFVGTIDGQGHILTVTAGVPLSVFGTFAGEIRDLVIDLTALAATDVKLFAGEEKVALTRVVIEEERSLLKIGAPVEAVNVWVETENAALKEAFMTSSGYSAYSLLFKNGAADYTFGTHITVTATDGEDQVFAGYFGEKGAVTTEVGREKTYVLSKAAGCVVTLNYINRTLSAADDLARLASGVAGGFEFAGETFYVRDGGFTVAESLQTIGDSDHAFKGSILGGVGSMITFASYGTDDTFVVRPLFHKLYGTLSDVIFLYAEGAVFEGNKALIGENAGKMNAVVVRSDNETLFAGGAGLTLLNNGETVNCWLVTRGTDVAVKEGNLVGVNELRVPYEYVDQSTRLSVSLVVGFNKTSQGTKVNFATTATTGRFVCYYDYNGKVVFPGNYNYATFLYTAPATSSGVRITVRDVNTIEKEDELVYLGYQCATGANLAAGSVITLAVDLVVERHLNALNFDNCVFDLAGHSLTLAATTDEDSVLFGKKTDTGKIVNGSIYLSKSCYGAAVAGTAFKNVTLFLEDASMTLPAYAVDSVTVVTTGAMSLTTASGQYRYLYAPKGAAIGAVYTYELDGSGERTKDVDNVYRMERAFVGEDNELYYFGGIEDGANPAVEEIARFAPVVIRTAADYEAFQRAANLDETNLSRAEITLSADVDVNGAALPTRLTYAGVLQANGHTVRITGGNFNATYLTVAEGGRVVDLALSFRSATISAERLISAAETGNRIALVVYQGATAKQEEDDASVVNVYGQGEVVVTFGEKLRFTARESGNYALREWKNDAGASLGNDLVYEGTGAASAHFALRYLVTVQYTGVAAEILERNAGDLPRFKGYTFEGTKQTRIYFADAIETAHEAITVEIEDIGEGFLFRSLTAASVGASIDNTKFTNDAWKFAVTWTIGKYDVVLNVNLTYIDMVWTKITYDAQEHREEELSDLRDELTAQGLTVQYGYTPLGATPYLVGGSAYHAGTYLVSFEVFSTEATGAKKLCNAYCGLEIEPAVLTFKTLLIKDKVYDGTAVAELVPGSLELEGFCSSDSAYISLVGLTFSFADANAEQGKPVYIAGNATLAYDATLDANGQHRYAYLDYTFDPSSIVTKESGLIRANISRKDLRLTVDSIKVDYLDQFDAKGDPIALVFRPNQALDSGLVAADEAAFNELASALITREKASTYDVGYYRIIVGDSLAMPNYNVVLTGEEAYYVVEPSLVKVIFDEDEMVYGAKRHTPAYHLFVGTEKGKSYRALRKGDEILFSDVVYNGGNEMLPGETRYSFTCYFSAENINYTVESETYGARNGVRLPILTGEKVLKVVPKTMTVVADDERNVKRFGKRAESLSASLKTGEYFVEKDHVLVVTREEGEAVADDYKLSFYVYDGEGNDVSDRYELVPQKEGGYFFRIAPIVLRIKPNKTSVVYGTPVGVIKYGVSVEGGGITIADLYFAMTGKEKADAGLADIGISIALGYDSSTVLPVGEYDAAFSFEYLTEAAATSISNVTVSNTHNMIVVQKRYLTITIKDLTKTYDGVKDFNESKVKFEVSGLLEADESLVTVKKKSYRLIGDGISVGVYKIDGVFEIVSKDPAMANNYYMTVVQGNLTVNPSTVKISAEVGYFDENGDFTTASIVQGGEEVEYTIYYGDAKAALRFKIESGAKFLSIPLDGTEKEQSDYIAKELRISYNRLNKLLPFYDDGKTTASVLGLISANNNVQATFLPQISIESVALTIRVLPSVKVIGDPDPEIAFEIIAKDPNDDYRVIEGYQELSKGTFSVTVTADRVQGETLGAYAYENVKVDILNNFSGESLFDESTETGKMFSDSVSQEVPADAGLSIEQQEFLKTTLGKILVYGGSLLVLLAIVILMLVFIPRIHRKRVARKKEKISARDLWNDGAQTPEQADQAAPTDGLAEGEAPAGGDSAATAGETNAAPAENDAPAPTTEVTATAPEAPSTAEPSAPQSANMTSTDDLFSDQNTNLDDHH